jgi:hypothetical protein
MIIGNGLIAKSFKKKYSYKNEIIFASGYANSRNKKKSKFSKEIKLLNKIIKKYHRKKIFYFSTLDVLRKKKTNYIIHKKNIEKILRKKKNTYILRLPQVVGNSKNQFTVYNYLKFNLKRNNKITIYHNYYRNFLDVSDIPLIINKLIKSNNKSKIINVFCNKSIKVSHLVNLIIKEYKLKNFKFIKNFKKDNFYKNMKKFQKGNYISFYKKKYYTNLIKKYL